MQWIIPGIIISYILGSIPTAYIFGRLFKGIDIRNFGSGNIGATNAFRVLGKKTASLVLLLDILKGFLSIVIIGKLISYNAEFIDHEAVLIILGIACVCGHNWTIFLKFKGGKGVATSLGVLLGLSIKVPGLKIVLALLILTWLLIFFLTKMVSLASILTAVGLPIYTLLFKLSLSLVLASVLLTIFVIARHKQNITRILQGKEQRLKTLSFK